MVSTFQYLRAASVREATAALSRYGGEARLLAGGTDLLPAIEDGLARPGFLIDLKGIPELARVASETDGTLRIGACATINDLIAYGSLPREMAAIREASLSLGTHQVRNRATVGGNLCNASPASDLGPPLLVLGAKARIASARGERTVPLNDFFKCPKVSCLEADEILIEILVPAGHGTASGFAKRTRIRGHDLAVVNAACALSQERGLRVAVGAVAPTPLLLDGFSAADLERKDRIVRGVLGAISPIDDVRGSSRYRKQMVELLVRRLLERVGAERQGRSRGL